VGHRLGWWRRPPRGNGDHRESLWLSPTRGTAGSGFRLQDRPHTGREQRASPGVVGPAISFGAPGCRAEGTTAVLPAQGPAAGQHTDSGSRLLRVLPGLRFALLGRAAALLGQQQCFWLRGPVSWSFSPSVPGSYTAGGDRTALWLSPTCGTAGSGWSAPRIASTLEGSNASNSFPQTLPKKKKHRESLRQPVAGVVPGLVGRAAAPLEATGRRSGFRPPCGAAAACGSEDRQTRLVPGTGRAGIVRPGRAAQTRTGCCRALEQLEQRPHKLPRQSPAGPPRRSPDLFCSTLRHRFRRPTRAWPPLPCAALPNTMPAVPLVPRLATRRCQRPRRRCCGSSNETTPRRGGRRLIERGLAGCCGSSNETTPRQRQRESGGPSPACVCWRRGWERWPRTAGPRTAVEPHTRTGQQQKKGSAITESPAAERGVGAPKAATPLQYRQAKQTRRQPRHPASAARGQRQHLAGAVSGIVFFDNPTYRPVSGRPAGLVPKARDSGRRSHLLKLVPSRLHGSFDLSAR